MIPGRNIIRKTLRHLCPVTKVLFVSFILFFSPFQSEGAVASDDFKTVDSETHRLFAEKKWDSVIIVGKRALRDNIDYFYLRLRMGISFFEIRKYLQAIDHLEKAHGFNSGDPMTMEYLFESYIITGRNLEARALAMKMPPALREKLQSPLKLVDNIHAEVGYTLSSNNEKFENPQLMGQDSIYGEQDLYGNHSYLNLGLTLNISPKISLNLAYNYLNFSKRKYFQYGYYQDRLDSTTNYWWGYENHYSWDKKVTSYQEKYDVNQHELYAGSVFQLPKGIKLMPAIHLIYSSSAEPMSVYEGKTIYDTIFIDTITPDASVYSFEQASYSFSAKNKRFINYLFSLMITKDFSVFTSGLAGSFSNLNSKNQTQLCWSLTYYPWGRTNIYGSSSVTGLFQDDASRVIFQQVIGGRILPRLWAEGSVIIGDLTNVNLMNGYIVYNNTDKINYRLGATLLYSLTKNIDISLIYHYFSNESLNFYYVLDPDDISHPVKTETKNDKYQTNTIIGGITWKF